MYRGGCPTDYKATPSVRRLSRQNLLLFYNAHIFQGFGCFLLIKATGRCAVGAKEHRFTKNGSAGGGNDLFHWFFLLN